MSANFIYGARRVLFYKCPVCPLLVQKRVVIFNKNFYSEIVNSEVIKRHIVFFPHHEKNITYLQKLYKIIKV